MSDVAFTFDDGPDPVWTPRLLETLDGCDVRATFFVMGSAAERAPDVVRAMAAAGHDVQLHCHEHRRHTTLARDQLEADTDRGLAALAALGVEPTLWRTPWGVLAPFTEGVAEVRSLRLVHWTADTEDWAGEPADALLARVADGLEPGAIILMHDGIGPGARRTDAAETLALVPLLTDACRSLGLEPGPATQRPQRDLSRVGGLGC